MSGASLCLGGCVITGWVVGVSVLVVMKGFCEGISCGCCYC